MLPAAATVITVLWLLRDASFDFVFPPLAFSSSPLLPLIMLKRGARVLLCFSLPPNIPSDVTHVQSSCGGKREVKDGGRERTG